MSVTLNAKLADCKPYAIDRRRIRKAERRTMLFKKHDNTINVVLRSFRKFNPPCFELVSVFNCPIFVHIKSIAYFLYRSQETTQTMFTKRQLPPKASKSAYSIVERAYPPRPKAEPRSGHLRGACPFAST